MKRILYLLCLIILEINLTIQAKKIKMNIEEEKLLTELIKPKIDK